MRYWQPSSQTLYETGCWEHTEQVRMNKLLNEWKEKKIKER